MRKLRWMVKRPTLGASKVAGARLSHSFPAGNSWSSSKQRSAITPLRMSVPLATRQSSGFFQEPFLPTGVTHLGTARAELSFSLECFMIYTNYTERSPVTLLSQPPFMPFLPFPTLILSSLMPPFSKFRVSLSFFFFLFIT